MEGRRRKWFYWVIMAIHVVGILIFTRGLLLTRPELPYYSNCSGISQSPCFSPSQNGSLGQYCWTKPAVHRVVVIVLDALSHMFSWHWVKRYIDVYSASSFIGFSSEDLLDISTIYNQAVEDWSKTRNILQHKNESCNSVLPALTRQINAYISFLTNIAELARSKWTEFNLKMMGTGFAIMLISISLILLAIVRENSLHFFPSSGSCAVSLDTEFVFFVMAIRVCSLLSNSYILEEGKVATFLLATIGVAKLRYSFMKRKMLFEVVTFLLLNTILRFSIDVGLSKQAATSHLWVHLPRGKSSLMMKSVAMLSAWSPTVIVLSGKQGSLVAIALVTGGASSLL